MIIAFLIGVLKTWLYVSGAAYIVWVWCGLRCEKYKDFEHLYTQYGVWAKPRYYSEIFIGSAITALAWPLQLLISILHEH